MSNVPLTELKCFAHLIHFQWTLRFYDYYFFSIFCGDWKTEKGFILTCMYCPPFKCLSLHNYIGCQTNFFPWNNENMQFCIISCWISSEFLHHFWLAHSHECVMCTFQLKSTFSPDSWDHKILSAHLHFQRLCNVIIQILKLLCDWWHPPVYIKQLVAVFFCFIKCIFS